MLTGKVDNGGRALVEVSLRSQSNKVFTEIAAWIDTGFTGDLVMPQPLIDTLQLPVSGSIDAVLADGSQIELSTYSCEVLWFGAERSLEVIANDGQFPLLGVGLMLGSELRINYRDLTVSLLPVNT